MTICNADAKLYAKRITKKLLQQCNKEIIPRSMDTTSGERA